MITRTNTLRFSDNLCLKNALNTFFLKILVFALFSFSLPPKHFLIIFSGKLSTKNSKKLPKGEKKFLFFYNLFHIFPLPLRKKTKPLTFFPLFITGNRKSASENVLLNNFFFFFFFFTFFHPTAPRNRKNYHLPFFSKFRLKCPKMPLSALKFHFLQITYFPPLLREHITYPHTLRFSDP